MNPTIRVLGFDHFVLITPDVPRILAFYMGTLGLTGVRVDEWRRGDVPFPSVRLDETTIIDFLAGDRTGSSVHHFCLTIEFTDLDELALSGEVEVVSGPTEGLFGAQGYARSLYVRDPDGNVIELRSY
jgi:catechol 2,3-dioxygenase-like lactoylglutathione lyase family enzyme